MAPKQLEPSEFAAMSRAMGPSEENWARMVDQGTGITATGLALKQHVEEHQIVSTMQSLMDHYPLTRAQIVESTKGKLYIQVRDEPVKAVVREQPWPEVDPSATINGVLELPNDEEESHLLSLVLNHILNTELNTPFVNEEKMVAPTVFEAHYYKNPSAPQTVVVVRVHSGCCDRHSCIRIFEEFVSALNASVEGKRPEFPDHPGKQELLSSMEEMIPKGKADKGFFTKGLNVIGYALDSKKYSLLPFDSEFTKMPVKPSIMSEFLAYSLGTPGTNAFFSACEKENVTPAAALASAYLKTAAGIEEMKEKKLNQFCFTGVLDCRPHFEPALPESVLGNYSAGIFQGAKVKEEISFWELAKTISSKTAKEMKKHKHFSELPVLAMLIAQVIKRPSLTPGMSKRSGLFTCFLGEPAKKEWQSKQAEMKGLNIAGTLGPLASMHGIGPCFSTCEYMSEGKEGPELCVHLTFATPVYTRDFMHGFATSAIDLLLSECAKLP